MDNHKALFEEYSYCRECKKLLPKEYEFELCPNCIENNLFKEVREYIRKNDVTEYDVAEEFGLPLKRVKGWIREGRIQYKEDKNKKIIGHHCGRCGELIMKGEFCTNCLHILKTQKATLVYHSDESEDSRMRFLDMEDKKNI